MHRGDRAAVPGGRRAAIPRGRLPAAMPVGVPVVGEEKSGDSALTRSVGADESKARTMSAPDGWPRPPWRRRLAQRAGPEFLLRACYGHVDSITTYSTAALATSAVAARAP